MKTLHDIVYNIVEKNPVDFYSDVDSSLIVTKQVKDEFGRVNDKIELHIYDYNDVLLKSDYQYSRYKVEDSYVSDSNQLQTLLLNPVADVLDKGYKYGYYKLTYNFFRTLISKDLFIKEIYGDRTEIRLSSNSISDSFIEANTLLILTEINKEKYVKDYVLNFGENNIALITNIALDNRFENKEILIKLYQPLDEQFDLKSLCSIEEVITLSHEVDVELDKIFELEKPKELRKANFDIDLEDKYQLETDYLNRNQLLTDVSYSSSLNSILAKKSYEINIDYTDFNDFSHFSSVKERVLNFLYKISLIENYQSRIDNTNITGSNPYNIANKDILENNIKEIFQKFDGYENYLYKNEYPKTGSIYYPLTSSQVLTWVGSDDESSLYYGGLINSASLYDKDNKNNLVYSIPEYLRVDEKNKPYELFLNMIGQHFDEIWTYIKKSTDIYRGNNNLDKGVSKDLVYDVLKNFGIKIYNTNDYSFFDSFKTSQMTSSLDIDAIFSYSKEDLDSELYKRIYHNLPYLLKTKGTERGIRALMAIYGIPDTIYRINEFGGFEKDYLQTINLDSIATYVLNVTTGSYLTAPYKSGSLDIPKSTYLRYSSNVSQTQSLFDIVTGSINLISVDFINTSSSYADIQLTIISGSNTLTASINNYSIYDGNFYDLNLNINSTNVVLNIQRQIDGNIAYKETASINVNDFYSTLNLNNTLDFITGIDLTGSLQNIQYHTSSLSDELLKVHTLNPYSVEPYDSLSFDIPLGLDLNTYNLFLTSSINNVTYTNFLDKNNFSIHREIIYYNSPNVGIRTIVNDKINYTSSSLEDNILSPVKSFQKIIDYNKTNNLNFLEIAFSPTYEINEDIISTYGTLNLDNYIGNPLDEYADDYNDLYMLRNKYFSKYISSYNYHDYFRLIKYFDNGLFKMVKDFVPFRTNLSTGIIVKQHILERSKIKRIPLSSSLVDISYDLNIGTFTGSFNQLYNCSGSYINYSEEFKKLNYNKFLTGNPLLKEDFNYSPLNVVKDNVQRNIFDRNDDTSYRQSRLDGIKLYAYKENIYTPNDKTYGKTPLIESYYGKMGIFTEIITNPILPTKSFVHLRYLVDKDGNLLELNRDNKNIFEVQNTFKQPYTSTISLFDNNKYDSQKSLDGAKNIYTSGYDYSPVLYFKNGENNLKFNFLDNQQQANNSFIYRNNNDLDITNDEFVYNVFADKLVDENDDFVTGSISNKTFPYYKIPSDGNYTFYNKLQLHIKLTKQDSKVSYSLTLYKNSPLDSTKVVDKIQLEFINDFKNSPRIYKSIGNPLSPIAEERQRFNNHWSNEINSLSENLPYVSNAVWEEDSNGTDSTGFFIIYKNSAGYLSGKVYNIAGEFRDYYNTPKEIIMNLELPKKNVTNNTYLNNFFNAGDRVYVVLQQEELNKNEVVANTVVLKNTNRISLNSLGEIVAQNVPFISSISTNKILFNKEVSNFYDKGIFVAEESQLYKEYGDVNDKFILKSGDLISIKSAIDNKVTIYEIVSVVFLSDGKIGCYIKDNFPANVNVNTFSEIIFIRKILDETVVVLNFRKTIGSTSYGYLLPETLNPNVLKNINKINKEVKEKLINENDINIIPYRV